MEISDFHVYEGEEEREYLDEGRSWDSGRDLSQKAGRSGIVDKGLLEPDVSRDIPFSEMEKKALKGSDYSSGRGFSEFWNSIDPRLRYARPLCPPVDRVDSGGHGG